MTSSNVAEELDYMSDVFVNENPEVNAVPGLVHNRAIKRSHNIDKRREKQIEEIREKTWYNKNLGVNSLNKKLQEPINAQNKGFILLKKMGYNPGSGLGKSGEGCKEPIAIEMKNDKFGLGRKNARKEMAQIKKAQRLAAFKARSANYMAKVKDKATERNIAADLYNSQKVCHQLDLKQGIEQPDELWFWPESVTEKLAREGNTSNMAGDQDAQNVLEDGCIAEEDIDKELTVEASLNNSRKPVDRFFQVALTPKDYPLVSFKPNQFLECCALIIDKVDELSDTDDISPKFKGTSPRGGVCLVRCIDKATKDWIFRIFENLQLPSQLALKAVEPTILMEPVVLVGLFPRPPIPTEKMIQRLVIQNREIGEMIRMWTVIRQKVHRKELQVLLRAVKPHLEDLKAKNFKVFYSFGVVKLKVISIGKEAKELVRREVKENKKILGLTNKGNKGKDNGLLEGAETLRSC